MIRERSKKIHDRENSQQQSGVATVSIFYLDLTNAGVKISLSKGNFDMVDKNVKLNSVMSSH